jgi:hypothetical protein
MVFSWQLRAVGANEGNQLARGHLEPILALDADLALIDLNKDHAFAIVACLQTK